VTEVDVPVHQHVVSNGKRDLTLDELAGTQPGMDRLMAEVGPRVHRMYYSARAGNWPLAEYFFRSLVKQLRLCAFSRPKYAAELNEFLESECAVLRESLRGRQPAAFEHAYAEMVRRANAYHDHFGKPYIKWRTPSVPPDDLDLTAGMDAATSD
jgi:hypothetical protein